MDLDLEMKISLGYLEHYFHQEITVRLGKLGHEISGFRSNRKQHFQHGSSSYMLTIDRGRISGL